ncbi:MAG TPA: DUF6691 family protein [Burkholderiales bacterium]|jgi:hypothetical protein
MAALLSFAAGLLFGIGLIVSGMSNPAKVLGFLDLTGRWDPSLMLVMGGAIAVGFIAFRAAGRRTRSWLGGAMHLPTARQLDQPLVFGSLAFGIGWGLAGICPGPALVVLSAGEARALVFVAAMAAGMGGFELFQVLKTRRRPAPA